MHDSDPGLYGDSVADIYDARLSTTTLETDLTVAYLSDVIVECGTPCLELGVGTGRIALPLAARGFAIHGIDASSRMLERLRAKPGAEAIETFLGDFQDLGALSVSYAVIFVVFSTFFALTSRDAQIRAFAAVAQRLRPGGRFVMQAFVPDPARLARRQIVDVRSVDVDSVRINLARYDPVTQNLSMTHLVIDESGTHLYPVPMRYAYPSELDLMAQLAGLRLRERWSSWRRDPFDAESEQHISVYER